MSCHSEAMDYADMVKITGRQYMLHMLAEECNELAHACHKMVRQMDGERHLDYDEVRNNLIEEIGDVQLMMLIIQGSVLDDADRRAITRGMLEKHRRMDKRLRKWQTQGVG